MPNIDPVVRFWIGIVVTIAIAVSQGTLSLTHAVPIDLIPYVTAWCGISAFIGSAVLTALNAAATSTSSRIASAAAVPEVKAIVTTSQVQAEAGGAKVITPSELPINNPGPPSNPSV